MHMDAQVVTLVFTIVTGVGVLLQACVLLGMYFALRETQKKIHGLTERVEGDIVPLVANVRRLVEDLSPKIKSLTDDVTPKLKAISSNLVETSNTFRNEAANIGHVIHDVTSRTQAQTTRVDGIVTGALNTLNQATEAVERGIAAPLRQVNGVLNGLRAGLDTLRTGSAKPIARVPQPTSVRPPASPSTPASAYVPPAYSPASSPRPVAQPVVTPPSAGPVAPSSPSPSSLRSTLNVDPGPAELTPEDASAAAARFVRDRAASERR